MDAGKVMVAMGATAADEKDSVFRGPKKKPRNPTKPLIKKDERKAKRKAARAARKKGRK